ncbi:MAG: autotransporter assembly complex family protein [Rhodospirillales bacterium]|nr:autotransporter assembly complex family protein [Rhodospirillales bacterium]
MRLLRATVPLLRLLPVLVLPACGLPQAVGLSPDRPSASTTDPEAIAYSVEIDAADDAALGRRLRGLLERSSQLIALKDRPPFTAVGLKRRIDGDIERFQEVLRSEGHYRASVQARVAREQTPPGVRLTVDPGPLFRLESFTVGYGAADGAATAPMPERKDLGVELETVARAPVVIAGEKAALRFLANRGHPLAEVADRKIIVDHATETMRVHLDVDPGPKARFGAVSVAGLEGVEEDYVRVLIPWRQGDLYDQRLVDRYRTRLLRTGLFSAVAIDRGEALAGGDALPVETRLVEGKQRSVGFGVRYSTGEGPAVKVFWEHRNLFGRNEDLGVAVEVGAIEQSAEVRFVRPDFRLPEQDLFVDAVATRTNSTAFNELSLETSAGLERPLGEDWRGSLATSLEWARLKDQEGSRTSTLAGLPAWLYYDGANDLYNPTKGVRLRLDATPYAGWFDKTVGFVVSEATGSAYVPLDQARRFVVAGRLRAGSIAGQPRDDVPANKRFYAGGGDSIRGYKFQEVGPIDDDNDPLGGRSLFETSLELRTRVWGNLGVVSFVEGGNVYEAEYPDFADPPRWAAGGGLRYFTPIGPVRLDIAFPLNRRDDIDDPYQFYIALGEAF